MNESVTLLASSYSKSLNDFIKRAERNQRCLSWSVYEGLYLQGTECTVTFCGPSVCTRPPALKHNLSQGAEPASPPLSVCPQPLLLALLYLPLPSRSLLSFLSAALPVIHPFTCLLFLLSNHKCWIPANSSDHIRPDFQQVSGLRHDLAQKLWSNGFDCVVNDVHAFVWLLRQLEAICHRGYLHINRSQCIYIVRCVYSVSSSFHHGDSSLCQDIKNSCTNQ